MRTLMLLRHAKAEGAGPTDHERPLAARGLRQARAVGEYLLSHGLVPDRVLCSTALRTRETWAEVAAALGSEAPGNVEFLEELYHANPRSVHALVAGTAIDPQRVLVVGHEPIMSMTAAAYAREDSDPGALHSVRAGMPTAALAQISLNSWGDANGYLASVVRADEG